MSVLLSMKGVRKSFGAAHALSGVDLEVREGEVHALLGENGAGKSTLMRILSGALTPDAGDLSFAGAAYRVRGPRAAEKMGIAMIHQERNLAPHLSVAANVVLGREPRAWGVVDRRRAHDVAERALARLGHPELAAMKRVAALGPGECQIVEIARALSRDARLLIMDEPTSSLSGADAERLLGLVTRLRADGTSVIYISHFLEETAKVADRFTVLRDGRTVASGSVFGTTRAALLEHMAGRQLDEPLGRAESEPGEVLLELDGLRATEPSRGSSLALRRGEILGLAGLLGAGRTELLRAVFGLAPVLAGRVRVAAVWDQGRTPRERLRQGIGLLSEDRATEGLALRMTLSDNVTLAHLPRLARFGFIDRKKKRAHAERWIRALDIKAASSDALVSSLSGGNQQKVALARLLDLDVDVFLLDEPTRGVDAVTKESIYRLLADLAARGKAILFVSSYVPELLAVCHRVAVMHRGTVSPSKPASAWTEAAILDAATGGAAA